ncbi:MAG: baseplate J/gp47 family protein [Candidatus Bathyarchaeota archaeon]|nr:baseplate J/gp47 family protein [Candidatus Bathyarchaeota archaeon]
MPFIRKDREETLDEMLDMMVSTTSITEASAGGVARSLLEVVNEQLGTCYDTLDTNMAMSFISTATGIYIDLIGEMLACYRLTGESDDNYRYRITQQVFAGSKSNETAIRLACLSVDGVRDIIMKRFTHGIGSFTVLVMTDEIDTDDSLIAQVQSVINENQALGIKGIAKKADLIPVDLKIRMVFTSATTSSEISSLVARAKGSIKDYVDSLGAGTTVVPNVILGYARQDGNVTAASISSLKIDNKEVTGSGIYTPNWSERYYLNSLEVIV